MKAYPQRAAATNQTDEKPVLICEGIKHSLLSSSLEPAKYLKKKKIKMLLLMMKR